MKNIVKAISFALVLVSVSSAQVNNTGKIALGIDGISSPDLAGKYFINNNIALELTAGFGLYSPGGDEPIGQTKVTGIDIRAGLACLYHFNGTDFIPFVGVDGMFTSSKTGGFYTVEPDVKNSVQANFVFGGEYFLGKHVSIGIKEKIGFEVQLSRDIPKEESDFFLNTGTIVTARYYFN